MGFTKIFFEGFILGLAAGGTCSGTCLVMIAPYLIAEGDKRSLKNFGKVSLFLLGKFLGYVGFAFLIALIGIKVLHLLSMKFYYALLIAVSLLMCVYGLTKNFPRLKLCTISKKLNFSRMPFLLGLFLGINPCPPFLVGMARILTLNNMLAGIFLFIAFFIGTSVYIVPLVFVSFINRVKIIQEIGVIMVLLSGLWFLFLGIYGILS